MKRNIRFSGGITVKESVAQVSELNGYLKDFPKHNRNTIQPLNDSIPWTKACKKLWSFVPAYSHVNLATVNPRVKNPLNQKPQ
eukprot:10654808-Ditylum_brightwellii.AAC.1